MAMLPVLIIVLGVALHAHSLTWGFLYDDFIHQSIFRYPDTFQGMQPWDVYDYGWQPQPGGSSSYLPDSDSRTSRPVSKTCVGRTTKVPTP